MSASSILTCDICKEIYRSPVILLCCSETVCKNHVDDMINKSKNVLKCSLCSKEKDATKEIYLVDKKSKAFIDKDLHSMKIDIKYKRDINDLKQHLDDLEKLNDNSEMFIHEKFAELKRKIHLDLDKVYNIALDMINQLEITENKLKSDSKYIKELNYKQELRKAREQLSEWDKFLKSFSTNEDGRKLINAKVNEEIEKIKLKIKNLKIELFSFRTYVYEPLDTSKQNLFGKLRIIGTPRETLKPKQQLAVQLSSSELEALSSQVAILHGKKLEQPNIQSSTPICLKPFNHNMYRPNLNDLVGLDESPINQGPSFEDFLKFYERVIAARKCLNAKD